METNLSGGYETNKNSGNPIRYADLSALDGSVTRQSDNFIYPQNQGFLIKLGSPASLMFQKENCPITSKIKFVDMSSALQVNVSSNVDVFRDCAELVTTVVRYALANQGLVDTSSELSTLINTVLILLTVSPSLMDRCLHKKIHALIMVSAVCKV